MCRFSVFRPLCWILLLCLCIAMGAPAIFAAEAPEIAIVPQTEEAVRGKPYRAAVRFHSEDDELISAFRLHLTYDDQYLTLTDIEGPEGTGAADFRSNAAEGSATAVFASLERPVSLKDVLCCTLVFRVKEDAAIGSAAVTAVMDQLVDPNLRAVNKTCKANTSITMSRLLSGNARLHSLIPSFGSLSPAFSPDVTEYTMTVPYTVKQLTFTAEPQSGASFRVNRKNMNAAGTPTTFVIKVTSEDKQAVTEYVITAVREKKPGASSANAAEKQSGAETVPVEPTGTGKEKSADGGAAYYGNRTIYYGGSQFAVFVLGISAAGICLLIVLLLCAKRKNKAKSSGNYRPKH